MRELSIFEAAREEPARDCVISGGRSWSFAQMAERAASAIGVLRERGIESGQRVAVTPGADLDSVTWLYALFELGCPAVLVHPRLTDRERARLLRSAEAAHLISETVIPPGPTSEPHVDPVPGDRTLAIVYTSGSRGIPRGARLSRRAFVASAAAHADNLGWRSDDRWLLGMPPAHVGGLSILTRCLSARRSVVLSEGPFDARKTVETLAREAVTLYSVVPTMLRRLLEAEDPVWSAGSTLRAVLVGGAPLSETLRARARARGIPVLATYGCTEACSQVATQTLSEIGEPGCGSPLRGIEVRIKGGEIQIRGDVLMDGYLGADERDLPFTEDGWLRTGDSGRLNAAGKLLVEGRLDDRIVTGGENVAPQEVEAWLEGVPGVTSAGVFGVPDEAWGQSVTAAIVVEHPGFDFDLLSARLRNELAPHKRPKEIAVLDALPLNRSGKLDRAQLAACCEGKLRRI